MAADGEDQAVAAGAAVQWAVGAGGEAFQWVASGSRWAENFPPVDKAEWARSDS